VVLPGAEVRSGLEVCIENGRIAEIRPWTKAAREEAGLLLSPAFVNAHSHLEYADLEGAIPAAASGEVSPYWTWIRTLTAIKSKRDPEAVRRAAQAAAQANRGCGVAALGEYSDWPVAGEAMSVAGIGGRIFKEVITLAEGAEEGWLSAIGSSVSDNSEIPTHLSAHATYTVSPRAISAIAQRGEPNAIHAAETREEREFFMHGGGPIADLYRRYGIEWPVPGMSPVKFLDSIGAIHPRTQIVHACAVDEDDIDLMARRSATVAYCPRSNRFLSGGLRAPIARMREKGITVGIGMDSAASSGAADFFDEMRAALEDSGLSAEAIWDMATRGGSKGVWPELDWRIATGADPDLILLRPRGASLGDQIRLGDSVCVVESIKMGPGEGPTPCAGRQ
jgi:cytosine/adenosine deaminase-related metal-dependent hydrolase